jgi:glycosyltransferase involved in cell wall biosynthesis
MSELDVLGPAPEFTLPSLSGGHRSLSDYSGRRLFLVFIQPGCPHSRQVLAVIAGLHPDPPARVPAPVIITRGGHEENRRLVEAYGIRCPVLVLDGTEVASAYQVDETPAACLIDECGRIVDMTRSGPANVLGQAGVMPGPECSWSTTDFPASRSQDREGGASGSAGSRANGRPKLLFLTPVTPSFNGPGVCRRPAMFLQGLAVDYDVYLLVAEFWDQLAGPVPSSIAAFCRAWAVVPPDEAASTFGEMDFHVVHTFTITMSANAKSYLTGRKGRRPAWHLDLDDIESVRARRYADRRRANGETSKARLEDAEARRFAAQEARILPRCDRVYVCSQHDRERLRALYDLRNVHVVPNVVSIPLELPPKSPSDVFTFLFVGRLDYFPNEDAILFLGMEILPMLRRHAHRPFKIMIVGGGGMFRTAPWTAWNPEMTLVGEVKRMEPWYQRADAVLAPIRAGGGTRIKILEAMSFRRPVVSTTIGAEGIDVVDDEHVLIGDSAEDFADCCLRLMSEPGLAARLAERAFDLCVESYAPAAAATALVSNLK